MNFYPINIKGVEISVTNETTVSVIRSHGSSNPKITALLQEGFIPHSQVGEHNFIGILGNCVYMVDVSKPILDKGFSIKLGEVETPNFEISVTVIDAEMTIENKGIHMKNCLRIRGYCGDVTYIDGFVG